MGNTRSTRRHPHPDLGILSRQQVAELTGFSISFFNHLPISQLAYVIKHGRAFYRRQDVVDWLTGDAPPVAPQPRPTGKKGRPAHPVIQGGMVAAGAR